MTKIEPYRIEEFDHVPPERVSSLLDGLYLDGAVRIDINRRTSDKKARVIAFFLQHENLHGEQELQPSEQPFSR
ncbi:MAG: hypothetical protein ABL951_06705 [Alphaproteobacteria bacterium]